MMRRLRAAACALIAAGLGLVLASCESRPPRTPHVVPPPIDESVLGIPDTAAAWVGEPRTASDSSTMRLFVMWDGTDPSGFEALQRVEAWHEAYTRFGLAVTGVHFASAVPFGDSVAVAAVAARLGLRFATAVSGHAPPPALVSGRGPTALLIDEGLAGPFWLGEPSQVRALEERIRAGLRRRHPEANFPSDGGTVEEAVPAEVSPWQALTLTPQLVPRSSPLAGARLDRPQAFTVQFRFQEEKAFGVPVPVGWWTPHAEGLEAARGGGANFIAIRYHAARVELVMAPAVSGPTRVWLLLDEHWMTPNAAGADVRFDARGAAYVVVDAPRVYEIARGGSHVLKVSPDESGVLFQTFYFEAATRP